MSPLALGYPLLGPSHHVRAHYCMPYSSPGFLCRDQIRHETFRHLFHRPGSFPIVLGSGCSRPLVGVDAENPEIVQETLHPLFLLAPHAARAPRQFSKYQQITATKSSSGPTCRENIARFVDVMPSSSSAEKLGTCDTGKSIGWLAAGDTITKPSLASAPLGVAYLRPECMPYA